MAKDATDRYQTCLQLAADARLASRKGLNPT
jgi:hypothetical protein